MYVNLRIPAPEMQAAAVLAILLIVDNTSSYYGYN